MGLTPLRLLVAHILNIASTYWPPRSLSTPNERFFHSTAGRMARSALLFVGSIPATLVNVHINGSTFRIVSHFIKVNAQKVWYMYE